MKIFTLSSSFFVVQFLLISSLLQVLPYTTTHTTTHAWYNISNSTQFCTTSIGVKDSLLIFIPAMLLGSNYVLLKRYNIGDGIFFQWMVCTGVWICGLVVHLIQSSAHFYPLAILGGVIWSGGNVFLIPMIRLVGFNTGVLMWSLVFIGSGWSTGFLSMMGVQYEKLCIPFFNYGGLVMCVSGVILLAFLKEHRTDTYNINTTLLINSNNSYNNLNKLMSAPGYPTPEIYRNARNFGRLGLLRGYLYTLSPFKKKVIGYILSILMGIAWGTHFLPMRILQTLADSNSYYSYNSLDYIFPYTTGVFMTSTLFMVLYSLYMSNAPRILPRSILPALIVGIFTGIAISLWAFLNQKMSSAVTFPIIASATPTIGFLWSIIAYRGWKNLFIFLVSIFVILSGITLVLLSKVQAFQIYPTFPSQNIISR
ncbi:putative membrane protein [Oopsacas minuta]|uniref:Membrane protein n=1 Tax=Oopsacas minuta TaxID=111878 RepID=A0AAV7JS71_9METZ|nr:putative membrane protein [Oopsacas minuta]